MGQHDNQCELPPTIKNLADDYALPSLETLFNQKAQDVEVARVYSLNIKEIGLKDAECVIRFSYLPAYRHPAKPDSESREGFSLSLRFADSNERITESIHCLDKKMNGLFKYSGGGTAYEGFEHMQFIIDNPPQKIIGSILNCVPLK